MRQDALQQDTSARADADDDAVDAVDAVIAQWRRERPDLDPSAKEIVGRIVRIAGLAQRAYAAAFEPLGISDADFGILAPLRRAGEPFELTPTELARQKLMTSGGMTAAIDRLERRGLLARRPNPTDRRGSLVRLTPEGRRAIDAAMERHAAVEHELIASLGARERSQLRDALHRLLVAVEAHGDAATID